MGHELLRDGFAGIIAFQSGSGNGLEITRLLFAGEAISHPAEQCRVDVVAGGPIHTSFAGRPNGVSRYMVDIEACPFSIDVLEGAVLVTRSPRTCDFSAADCRVDPSGVWGPQGDTIGPEQAKQLERERGRAESDMRARFRALLTSAGRDNEAIKKIASEQAGFSSEREVTCRAYRHEDVHGFCALRITQARVLALQAEFADHLNNHAEAAPSKAAGGQAMTKKKGSANFKLDAKANPNPEPNPAPQPEPAANSLRGVH